MYLAPHLWGECGARTAEADRATCMTFLSGSHSKNCSHRHTPACEAAAPPILPFYLPEIKKPAFAGFFPRTPDGLATPALRISCCAHYTRVYINAVKQNR